MHFGYSDFASETWTTLDIFRSRGEKAVIIKESIWESLKQCKTIDIMLIAICLPLLPFALNNSI